MTPPTPDMSEIVVSYERSTARHAQIVARALRALGYDVWLDDELPAHRAYETVIKEHLVAARAVVVIWSAEAAESDWVRSEANQAREARKLVQLTIDNAPLPMPFDQIQCANLKGWSGDPNSPGWRKVEASVAELVHNGRSPEPIDVRKTAVVGDRRRMYAVALLGLVAIVAATWYSTSRMREPGVGTLAGTTASNASTATFAGRPAIAVLPFKNLSADPQHAIFADGLAEDLITRLSSWRAFPVIAPGSSFQYRGDVDLKKVASELDVRYVVQGSVQRAGDRIRIAVQLVDTQSNKDLWSRTYDRTVADVFELQDEIGSTVAASLVADLTRAEGERAQQRDIRNLDAWSAYELGMQRLTRASRKDYADARALFEQALALEPQSASVTAALSSEISLEVIYAWTDSAEANAARALELARRAVELDSENSAAHAALASALTVRRDFQSAIASAERAVELNPSAPQAWAALAYAKDLAGDPKGDIAAIEQAIRLDPQSSNTAHYYDNLSMACADAGQYDSGLQASRKVVASYPDYAWGYVDLATNAVPLGRIDEARAAIVEARRLQPNLSQASIQSALGISRPEIDARRNAVLSRAGLD